GEGFSYPARPAFHRAVRSRGSSRSHRRLHRPPAHHERSRPFGYRDTMTAASVIFDDLAAEQDALAAMLGRLGAQDWAKPSGAEGWSIGDVVLHLAQTEELVSATVNGTMSGLRASDPAGKSPSMDEAADQAVAAERGQPHWAVFARWQSAHREALT